MKKFHYALLIAIIGAIISCFIFLNENRKNFQLGKSFTPNEFYKYEIQQKKIKSESKNDRPDEFSRYFKDITTRFGDDNSSYPMNYKIEELKLAKVKRCKLEFESNDIVFVQRGPANVGGRTRGLIVDPNDQKHNTWFAGAATGGIWKTTDGGHTWTCLTDDFPNLSANTLAMAASNTQIIYVGTGESFPGGTYLEGNGIFKTTDKGENWTQLESTTNNDYFTYINRLIVDPNNEDIVIVATEKGIMKTTDGGIQWDTVYTSNNGIEDLVANPNNFNILYAGENSTGILKSTNAGKNWALSFDELKSGLRYEIAVSPVDPNIVYTSINVSSTKSYVYRSIDAGENWMRFEDKDGNNMNYLGGQGEYDNIIEAHPYNKDIAFIGGVNLWKVDFSEPGTINYGKIQSQEGTIYNVSDAYGQFGDKNKYNTALGLTEISGLHPDHHNLIMVPINETTDSFLIINTNDGGLGISFDSGENFNQLPYNYITTQFYGAAKKPGTNEFIGGMQDNGTWRSRPEENATSSSDYLFQLGGDGFECMWHYTKENKIIGSIYNNAFFRTIDGGKNWSWGSYGIEESDGPFISRISSHPSAPDILYAVGAKGIYKSENFARSWTMKELPEGWNLYADEGYTTNQHNVEVSLANENIVWAGCAMSEANGWKIFVSTDQGETFNPVNEFTEVKMDVFISGIATHPNEDSTAYLLFSLANEPKILRTEDLGQTWEDITGFVGNKNSSNGFPNVVTHSLLVLPDEPNTIWAGTDIGLFESKDNGATWHYTDYGIPSVSIYDMFYQDAQVIIATHGRGIWTAKSKYAPEINSSSYIGKQTISSSYVLFADADSIEFYLDDKMINKIYSQTPGTNNFNFHVDEEAEYNIKLISYSNGLSYESNYMNVTTDFKPVINSLFKPDNIDNTISIDATINEHYDSIQIVLDNEVNEKFTSFNIGNNIINTVINQSKSYRVKIIGYLNDKGYESNFKDISMTYVGIPGIYKVEILKIYPNPTKGDVSVELPENIKNRANVDVYSISGIKVFTKTISKNDNRINLSNLNNGIYTVVINQNGEIFSNTIQIRK